MDNVNYREYRPGDVPALSLLWRDVFGDSLRLIANFFALLPDMGSYVVAEEDGVLLGGAGILNGFELVTRKKQRPVVAYLYAVMVREEERGRGIGKGLCLEAEKLARRRESELLTTLPAGPSLYGWYRRLLGLECVLHRKRFETGCAPREPVMEMTSTEYQLWRDNLLKGRAYLRPSPPTMEFERRFCQSLGGGLYACSSGICTAYLDGETCFIKELITNRPEDAPLIAASVGAELGARVAVWYLPAREGEAYLAAKPGAIPADCVWNLTFD